MKSVLVVSLSREWNDVWKPKHIKPYAFLRKHRDAWSLFVSYQTIDAIIAVKGDYESIPTEVSAFVAASDAGKAVMSGVSFGVAWSTYTQEVHKYITDVVEPKGYSTAAVKTAKDS